MIWTFTIALALRLATGLIVSLPVVVLQPLGDLFLRLLRMLVAPLVLVTLLSGAAPVSPASLGRSAA